MTHASRASALLMSGILLLTALALPVRAQSELPVDDLMSSIEFIVTLQDSQAMRDILTTELEEEIGPVFDTYLNPSYTISEFDLYGYEVTTISEEEWHIESKYSIEAKGPNGSWSANGLSTFIDLVQIDEDAYLVTDTDLHEAVAPLTLKGFIESFSSFFLFFFIIFAALMAFYIWMLVDVIRYQKEDRTLWVLVVLLGSVLGALIYFFTERRKRVAHTLRRT